MSLDLRPEMENLRRACFGPRYDRICRILNRKGNEQRKKEFRELEDYFFQMVTYILSNQHETGWWNDGQALQNVVTAHSLRHLHRIGIPLKARWNLKKPTDKEGNLFRATKLLVGEYRAKKTHSYWGTDVWDDCYILLALFEVRQDLDDEEVKAWDQRLAAELHDKCKESLTWLTRQFDKTGFNNKVAKAAWFGPGFYAAAIELLAHRAAKEHIKDADKLIEALATTLGKIIQESFTGDPPKWHKRFAWHAGQVLVTWKEKRKSHEALKKLDSIMKQLLDQLGDRQSDYGAWDDGQTEDEEYQVYYTVRGLAACYVNTEDKEILESPQIARAHQFLLNKFKDYQDGQLINPKASINALGAFQKLFEFQVDHVFPTSLISLAMRINRLGILQDTLAPFGSETEALRKIRNSAREQIEKRGDDGLEILGINYQLYHGLQGNDEFLKEFTGDRTNKTLAKLRAEILKDLKRCLSTTLTETRSKFSHRLIARLWDTDGFLNFKPLIEHLSLLEQDRAFYKYYRDHLNHELLLFLFGAYIYYECGTFREKLNDEMRKIYDDKKIKVSEKDLPREFLFRWKLIATFHDIGYLFEVDPFEDKSSKTTRKKTELIEKSWQVVDGFRDKFLFDYFMQTIDPSERPGINPEAAATAHKSEVEDLAAKIHACLKSHPGQIHSDAELLDLSTGGPHGNPFKLISQFVNPGHIGPDLIKNYFYLCGSYPVLEEKNGKLQEQRPPFYDHGIMSALILLKATDIQRHYLKQLSDEAFAGNLDNYPTVSNLLRKPKTIGHLNPDQFFIRFSHVAGAIALHNIWPGLYRKEQCAEFDRSGRQSGEGIEKAFYPDDPTSPGYGISLDENPLAYLTALADTLQDWDRHSFRRLSFVEDADPLTSSEVTIEFGDDKRIRMRPLTDEAKAKYAKLTAPTSMGHLLEWDKYLKIDAE